MFNMLIKLVFTIITKLFSIILSPILSIVLTLFPDLSEITTTALSFFNDYVYLYISFLIKMLEHLVFLPHWIVVFLFDYFLIKYTIYITVQAVRFAIQVYNKLKP